MYVFLIFPCHSIWWISRKIRIERPKKFIKPNVLSAESGSGYVIQISNKGMLHSCWNIPPQEDLLAFQNTVQGGRCQKLFKWNLFQEVKKRKLLQLRFFIILKGFKYFVYFANKGGRKKITEEYVYRHRLTQARRSSGAGKTFRVILSPQDDQACGHSKSPIWVLGSGLRQHPGRSLPAAKVTSSTLKRDEDSTSQQPS